MISPCRDITNLHFHGLEISSQAPQDNALDMIAMPIDTLHYVVETPPDYPSGLFWYLTRIRTARVTAKHSTPCPAPLSSRGWIAIFPNSAVREHVLVVRAESIEDARDATALLRRVEAQAPSCGSEG